MGQKLFPIPVRGIGTAEIESLPSYLHRLAHRHGVYVGELLKYVDQQIKNDVNFTGEVQCLPSYIKNEDILRNNVLAGYLISGLEYLTGQSLMGTCASFINNQLNMSKCELLGGFRWCPECMAEMEVLEEEPYFKLIWQFRAVQKCPIHRTSLLAKCVECGCTQTSYKRLNHLGICQQCLNPLSRRLKGFYHLDCGSEDAWDIIQLIADIQKFGERQLPTDGVIISVNELFDQYWQQHREDSFYSLLSRDKLLTVVNEKKTLSLNDARKLCFQLGISLFDLMCGNATKVSQSLGFDDSRFFPKNFLHASVRVVKDHKFFLKRLKELNESDDTPISLKATAKALGVSIGYLEYRFPAQVRLIVDRHQSYLDQDHLRKVYLAQTQALQYFLDVSENRAPKSRKHAYKQLREETGLPKWVLKKAIQTAYQAITASDMGKHMIA